MTSDVLILFFKYPEKGRVKSRIARFMGNDFARELYASFIRDILVLSRTIGADKIIALDGPGRPMNESPDFGTGYRTIRQKGEDIGARMYNAFMSAYDAGYERAVLIGSDCPDMPAEYIETAFAALRSRDVALGKTADGGYYLIACTAKSCRSSYFQGIDWSTPYVFQQTVMKISESGEKLFLLPQWNDIDDMNGLKRFYENNRGIRRALSSTMQYLNRTNWDRL